MTFYWIAAAFGLAILITAIKLINRQGKGK